jgi:hypothetical protein
MGNLKTRVKNKLTSHFTPTNFHDEQTPILISAPSMMRLIAFSASPALVTSFALFSGCSTPGNSSGGSLTGAWRGHVQFTNGAFAEVKDLEFMYVFNAGGTMTESSNYDGAPPVPPAYGIWRRVGPGKFEAKYAYFWTKPPTEFEAIAKGGGWNPGGYGVITQHFTIGKNPDSFESEILYEVFDQTGKQIENSAATATATRMRW